MIRRVPQLKKVKLDIGCGEKPHEGYVGMDVRDCGQQIVWDARQGIPFPDSSVDEILTSDNLLSTVTNVHTDISFVWFFSTSNI